MSSSVLSLLWWVAIGLFFFWMMSRGGCGMMGHGRGHGHDPDRANGHSTHKPSDPVCGMEVDPATAAGTRTANRETLFFCSQTCLEAFDKNSTMYAQRRDQRSQHRAHAGC